MRAYADRAVDFDLGEMLSDVRGMITAQAHAKGIRVASRHDAYAAAA